MMKNVFVSFCVLLVAAVSVPAFAGTVAYWDFEDGTANQAFTPEGTANGSGGSVDSENGYLMRGWDNYWGPGWTDTTATGSGLAMRNEGNHQDGYSYDAGLVSWSPSAFTIEATFMLHDIGGNYTLIGRHSKADSTPDTSYSAMYFQTTWDNYFRFDFATAGGERFDVTSIDSGIQVAADTWYSMAVTSDGSTLSLYVNDIAAGAGWAMVGQTDMSSASDSAMSSAAGDWVFGRGWWNGGGADHIDGYMDDIRLSDTALTSADFVTVPEPATMLLLGLGGLMLRKRK